MKRQRVDKIVSISGLIIAVVIAVAGGLLLWGGTFAHNTVTTELTTQKITFSEDATKLPPELQSWAGTQVTDGPSAKAYSDLIAVHVAGVAGGKTYSEVSEEWMAGGMKDATLAQQRTTLFMGESLRAMLLNAYAFWTVGTVAIIASFAAFGVAIALLILALLGFRHAKEVE
ncbi:MAG: hypothetical protein PHU75_08460 [Candidatus Nanopelagicales bacterium]|nr:hypothetical protein [Candidatus Nanopelagicales bacterium]